MPIQMARVHQGAAVPEPFKAVVTDGFRVANTAKEESVSAIIAKELLSEWATDVPIMRGGVASDDHVVVVASWIQSKLSDVSHHNTT